MLFYGMMLGLAKMLGYLIRPRAYTGRCEVVVTGTFYSDNWITSHLRPLAASGECSRLWVVSTYPIPRIPNVEAVAPSHWLQRTIGKVPARLMLFAVTVLRRRPAVVGGFHLLVNGLVAAVLARLVRARSMYFCVGGPMEVLDGGVWAENRVFGLLETPDPVIERRLLRAVSAFDLVITMGTRAVTFLKHRGVESSFHVVSGGIESHRFSGADSDPSFDLIMVGRLASIKRVDVFLRTLAHVRRELPDTTAVIVGEGPLRGSLEELAHDLGLRDCVTFAGHQNDVEKWLKKARIFVLCSDSEGLALSLMEAMMCGLPAVVSNVGDLADLVEEGVNGYLVERRSPEAAAARIVDLLGDETKRAAFARAAHQTALRHDTASVTRQWDSILGQLP